MLTSAQISHFETFGFVVTRQAFSPDEVADIIRDFTGILEEDRQGQAFAGEQRHAVLAFVEKTPLLRDLVADDRIYGHIQQLLGPNFIWRGSDGNLYVGDTAWHPDATGVELNFTRIKVAMYLDPVTADTGCLRVVPGSHRLPLHQDLEPMRYWRVKQTIAEGRATEDALEQFRDLVGDDDEPIFGVQPPDLPGFPLESEPGDVVFFNQHIYHGSFGGHVGRRMFTMNFAEEPKTDEHIELLKREYAGSSVARDALQYTKTDRTYEPEFLHSDSPRIQSMVAKLIELGFE